MAQTSNDLVGPARTRPATVFQSWPRSLDRPEMYIRKAKPRCRHCRVPVKADARRCHSCGAAYPTSELLAVVLSANAVAVYVVVVLAFITLWFLQ
jgi:hypothetical protein